MYIYLFLFNWKYLSITPPHIRHWYRNIGIWLLGVVVGMGMIPGVLAETDCNAVSCDADGENCQPVSLMPVAQCQTLLAFYHSTDGFHWRNNDGWNTTNESRDFALIETDNDGNVIALNLVQNRLTGVLPDLTALTNLQEMNLRNNKLKGPLPDLSAFAHLETLSLYQNQLCGQIPDLSALTNLKRLDLSYNELSGPIPSFSKLKNLQSLGLSGNQLCRDKKRSYAGFEYAVNNYPVCADDEEYPLCQQFALAVSKEGTGNGNISGEGIECGSDCSEQYTEETEVTLTATPNSDSTFIGWAGACSGTDTCIVLVSQAQQVTATFQVTSTVTEYELIVNPEGTGNGSVTGTGIDCGSDCNEQYAENTQVTLKANPASNSIFEGWRGACLGTAETCVVPMNQAREVIAVFNLIPSLTEYQLTINKEGTGTGNVTGNGINCGSDCREQYTEDTQVTLDAIPAADSSFVEWRGACSGTGTCIVSMNTTQQVTAIFNVVFIGNQYLLTVNKEGTGTGNITGTGIDCGNDCSEQYAENTIVMLNANPEADSILIGWRGACVGANPCQVTMNQEQTVTASFERVQSNSATELEFLGLQEFYEVGEWITLDLQVYLQTPPHFPRLDLWVGIEAPDGTRYYMTELPFQPFSLTPQPYRRNIADRELLGQKMKYHLLYFDVPPGIGGTYFFYATHTEAGVSSSDMLFTQQSSRAFASTVLSNNLNPSILPTPPDRLTMLVDEELEVIIHSERTLDAILNNCTVSPPDIMQSYSAQSSNGSNSISCYLTALTPGSATLTTINQEGNISETRITVR